MQLFFRSLIFALMGSASWVKVDNLLVTKETISGHFWLTLEQGVFSGKVVQKPRMSAVSGNQSF